MPMIIGRILVAVAVAIGLGGQPRAAGFKETVKIIVSGPRLARPIEIRDAPALTNVYGGNFMTTPATEPDKTWQRYTVSFCVNTRDRGIAMLSVVRYARKPLTGDGFLYLPGHGEKEYGRDVRTIIRDGQDGRWYHAAPAWSKALNAHLPRSKSL
jgi:hypothetical protein